jgi:type IV pilus assembly protein PilP
VASAAAPPRRDFPEAEFTETERSRDPFRPYAKKFAEEAKGHVKSQRQVILSEFSVDDLKLIGIVTRLEPARAMLVDPTGKGHVVRRGDFVGRADVVQMVGAAGATYELNWRLDRIRDGDVVLVREDPNNPDVPAATKVIPLRPEGGVVTGG